MSTPQNNNNLQTDQRENRADLIRAFVVSDPDYYQRQFTKIGSKSGFSWTFNLAAALLGPIWFGMRSLWHWGLPFAILEAFALIQIARGGWGDLAADARARIEQIETTLNFRREQLDAAIANNADNVEVFKRTIASLEQGIADIQLEIQQIEASAIWVAGFGVAMLMAVKLIQGISANPILERRFSDWLSDRMIKSGLSLYRTLLSVGFVVLVYGASVIHFSFPSAITLLAEFPTDPAYRLTSISWIENFFNFVILNGEWFFDVITSGIRALLDGLELIFVQTPWIVIASFIILLTGLSAGPRAAIYAAAFLAYMGLLGFWEKAMTTLALLGTAACISIALGIPLGMFCARRPALIRVYPSDHGFYADDARVRIHDSSNRIFSAPANPPQSSRR